MELAWTIRMIRLQPSQSRTAGHGARTVIPDHDHGKLGMQHALVGNGPKQELMQAVRLWTGVDETTNCLSWTLFVDMINFTECLKGEVMTIGHRFCSCY